jgi:Fe-S cluster assembly protein SufD
MAVSLTGLESYLGSFTTLAEETAGQAPTWLRDLRENAFVRFCRVGFPNIHDEDWRFTNLTALARTPYRLASKDRHGLKAPDLATWRMKDARARIVFIDGHFSPEMSTFDELQKGVTITGLDRAIVTHEQIVRRYLGRYADIERDPFCALNTAFIQDGAFVHIDKGVVVAKPIHLLFVSTSGPEPIMTQPRNLIVVEQEAQASIVEEYVSWGAQAAAFSNAVTELVARENSTVAHTFIEREHAQALNFTTLRIQQARNANVASHSLLLGGALVRNNVHPVLAGEGAECLINGLFVGKGSQHLDNFMVVEHATPHCGSRQFYNGILDDRSRGVFHGRIIVHKDAQKTDAKQTNRNLLLSDDAQIDTKPQLEIYADDVKCTHGATIGQIEESALFYLRSRGLSEADARRMLVQAFAGECIERIPAPVREYCQAIVSAILQPLAHLHSSESIKVR